MSKIPKIIHYCWFGGGEEGPLIAACKASWQKYMPEYQVIRWDESNTDMSQPFIKHMYKRKCWAFVSDYVRLQALLKYGGFYFDTDIEAIRSFDTFLDLQCFYGEEQPGRPANGLMGSVPEHPFMALCLQIVQERWETGKSYLIGPEQLMAGLALTQEKVIGLPYEYFYPYNPYDLNRDVTVLMHSQITENTHAIHHWNKSWKFSFWELVRRKLRI